MYSGMNSRDVMSASLAGGGLGAVAGLGNEALGRILTRMAGPRFEPRRWARDQDPHRVNSALKVAPLGLSVLASRLLVPHLMKKEATLGKLVAPVVKALRFGAKVPSGQSFFKAPVRNSLKLAINPYMGRHGWIPKTALGVAAGVPAVAAAGRVRDNVSTMAGMGAALTPGKPIQPFLQDMATNPVRISMFPSTSPHFGQLPAHEQSRALNLRNLLLRSGFSGWWNGGNAGKITPLDAVRSVFTPVHLAGKGATGWAEKQWPASMPSLLEWWKAMR